MSNFKKLDASGQVTEADDYVAVMDESTGLIWDRSYIEVPNQSAAEKRAAEVILCGKPARAPTIQEQLSIVDYDRYGPAIDPIFNCPEYGLFWTSTRAKASPSDCAWVVDFGGGLSLWGDRYYSGFVRAVRPSQ